ncbi:MAG: hypothetical protein ACYDGN_10410 [Acidimicrobiales bacterium]
MPLTRDFMWWRSKWDFGPGGPVQVQHSTDSGSSWLTVFPRSPPHTVSDALLVAFAASPRFATLVVETYPKSSAQGSSSNHFLFGLTGNGGATWHWAHLPALTGS